MNNHCDGFVASIVKGRPFRLSNLKIVKATYPNVRNVRKPTITKTRYIYEIYQNKLHLFGQTEVITYNSKLITFDYIRYHLTTVSFSSPPYNYG